MDNKNIFKNLVTIKNLKFLFLPLLSSAAVLRKEKILRELLEIAKTGNIKSIKIYESLLQTYLFAGFPNALMSLQVAAEYFPPKHEYRGHENSFWEDGLMNCKRIYGNKFEKLISNVSSFSPELSNWLITEGYGKVFGRKNLSLKERELCNVAVLASLKYQSQLYSHINGAFRLHNSPAEIGLVMEYLELTGGKRVQKFGMKVLDEYLRQKGTKT